MTQTTAPTQTKGAKRIAILAGILPSMPEKFTVADIYDKVKDHTEFSGTNDKAVISSTITKIPGVRVVETKPNATGKGKPCNVLSYKAA